MPETLPAAAGLSETRPETRSETLADVLAEQPLPAPTGRRRKAPPATETLAEFAAAAELPVAAVAPGTGRRRRVAAAPAPIVEPTIFTAAPAPVVEAPVLAPIALEIPAEPILEPVVELASRAERREAARKHAKRSARTHASRRRKVVVLPAGAPSGTSLIAGAAAVAVAAAGVVGAVKAGGGDSATSATMTGASALGVTETGSLVDSASVNREQARASRERARDALADRIRAAEELQKKQEAAARALAAAKARAQQLALLAKNYSLPVRGYHLTATFGAGGYRWAAGHTGLDFACGYGSPIRAVAAGTVIFAGYDGAYGYKTVIRHLDGTESWYAHQSQILVRRGQVVAGQVIGRVGMTGNTSGPHLHLEIRINDRPVNPYNWLRSKGLRP
ncbi:M23 family metallopeptidase [Sporichthya brevicatena]|uniref:M23 family metallopeptidase n=1 Tax=Sporichthya brevicatena TaxID=171442 RepID=UPI0031E3E807